ncbi:DUF3524 domain-containing protein [Endozoicomonas sp. OPT23]|uniref:tRNA-queuosine alpha-mannosyltransferase domain-containing protein n=1 Tax=Endozoicomonas sp. OPT23 TaxID=2072845 RepID=UPI00129BFDC8|nr:DUF3524 domain-containing protein [Endozoicomonas sp. OPT23]MRI34612.1 DUF3524 domain-containing protein [Endozoicomonas sp. OPT23]
MKILLLSAYDAMSHGYWRKGLVNAFPEYDWTVLTLPPRYFSWRLRGNSLSWAWGERETLEADYDLLICTSMTDLSALKGMVPSLAAIPTLCYFHENQFAYPASANQSQTVEPQILNIYTALAADHVLFNTAYNRHTFLEGAKALLRKLPDHVPANVIEQLERISSVLPVPLPEKVFQNKGESSDSCLHILWNHRWEYDKAPERLFKAIELLEQKNTDFKLHVVGQGFRNSPAVFAAAREQYADVIGHWGYVDSEAEYRRLLSTCDLVISTAIHDFQGIAVLEAVAAGCLPVVPDRLAYKELFANRFRYESYNDLELESKALAEKLFEYSVMKEEGWLPEAPSVSGLSWSSLRACYDQRITELAEKG